MNGAPMLPDMLPGIGGLPGTSTLDASMPEDQTLGDITDLVEAPAPPDPLDTIEDSTLLQIMETSYKNSADARATRKRLNDRNWDALHGKFAFLAKKKPGQSTIVIPSLETSLEQVCAQLTRQLVGFSTWFSASYEGDVPPLPGMAPEQAVKILRQEIDRLAVDSGCMPTTYGIGRLIHDSIKIGCIESEITWKVMMEPEDQPKWELGPGGDLVPSAQEAMRLRIDLVPFDDHFPDPSPSRRYNIHEVEVAIADLPAMGFTPDEIAKMKSSSPGSQKLEESRRRSGIASGMNTSPGKVLLREYWGDLVHPQTHELIEKQCMFVTAASTHVVRRPIRIREELWVGVRPFISIPLLPTPTSSQHHAFLDIAVPLVEAECELFNLLVDSGFHAGLGVKEIRSYMLKDPTSVQGGVVAGMNLEIAEGRGDGNVLTRVDSGTLSPEMLTIFDRIARTRQEAMRTNDAQLGRLAARKSSATEMRQIDEASDDLFSSIATRVEDNGIEPLLELCWLLLWQFADQSMLERIKTAVGPENGQSLAMLTPQERFMLMANATSFKVQGYKYQLSKAQDLQKVMMMRQSAAQNPALAQVLETKISPLKEYRLMYQSIGIDPTDLEPSADEPKMDPMMLANQSGGQNPAAAPGMAAEQEQVTPPNPGGDRMGAQYP